jgi:hypothetical protein
LQQRSFLQQAFLQQQSASHDTWQPQSDLHPESHGAAHGVSQQDAQDWRHQEPPTEPQPRSLPPRKPQAWACDSRQTMMTIAAKGNVHRTQFRFIVVTSLTKL